MSTVAAKKELTDEQLANYAKLILKVAGIRVSPQKKMLLSNRIGRRLKVTGIECYQDYYDKLCSQKGDSPEWDAFLQEITTHETFLFRDENHWKWFREEYLPGLAKAAAGGKRKKTLRIWSAACSTGDEAYTIASCIASNLSGHAQWKIEIVGTDIGVGAVEAAQKAEFNLRAMRLVPKEIRTRCFDKLKDQEDVWSPKQNLRAWTSFSQHNLLSPATKMKPFDLIILKNVLIYFDDNAKETTAKHLCDRIVPGGILITSAADNVNQYMGDFTKKCPWQYVKPQSV